MQLTVDLNENSIDVERVAVAIMPSLQSPGVDCSELDAPMSDRFASDNDASVCQEVFDITVAEIESIVEPDGVRNHFWRDAMAFICIHWPILPISAS